MFHGRRVRGGEREGRLALVRDQIWRHGIGDMLGDMWIKASATLPVLHGRSVAELLRKVVKPILPFIESLGAEATARVYGLSLHFPRFHAGSQLTAVPKLRVSISPIPMDVSRGNIAHIKRRCCLR